MALELQRAALWRTAGLIMDGCLFASRTHPDPLLDGTTVSGSFVNKIFNEHLEAKLYYIDDFRYLLWVDTNHYYLFGSRVDLGKTPS